MLGLRPIAHRMFALSMALVFVATLALEIILRAIFVIGGNGILPIVVAQEAKRIGISMGDTREELMSIALIPS